MTIRQWQLSPSDPFVITLSADARMSETDYADDQTWELSLGSAGTSALALTTRYGGRAGFVALVPMWTIDGKPIADYQSYATPPIVRAFTPNYIQSLARLTPTLDLRAEYLAYESHAVGGRFTLHNTGTETATLQFKMIGFVGIEGKEMALRAVPLTRQPDETRHALALGPIGKLQPVVIVDGAQGEIAGVTHKANSLDLPLTVPPNAQVSIRWSHAGTNNLRESIALAQHWLTQDWGALTQRVIALSESIPQIETGNTAHDAVISASINQLLGAFLRSTAHLPHPSFVAARHPARGFSPRGDGSDHIRGWSGQTPTLAYLTALGIASTAPDLAHGVIRNYLAAQQADGWIDWKPGLAGQRQNLMCLPILARLAWGIFQYTEDDAFLREVYPKLRRFFDRWFGPDLDRDQDGLPEWQADVQNGYGFAPTFAPGLPWAQNADIRFAESPDLLAFLLSEAISLHEIGYYLREPKDEALKTRISQLEAALESLWYDERGQYGYRDRDTHAALSSVQLLTDGAGDEEHFIAETLEQPNRLVIRIEGGVEHTPKLTLQVSGLDATGQAVEEIIDGERLVWTRGRGVVTTQTIFSRVDRLKADGLVRVYKISASTLDLTRSDLSGVMPLWAVKLPPERVNALADRAMSDLYLHDSGVSPVPTNDPAFDPSHEKGSGGSWVFWNTLIGEGLIEAGRMSEAAKIARRLLDTQASVLSAEHAFHEFYHAAEARGLGERGSILGAGPLHLLMRVFGVRIVSSARVWAGGEFVWDQPVTITQHGVRVERSANGTWITFPSGREVNLPPDAPLQELRDPSSAAPQAPMA